VVPKVVKPVNGLLEKPSSLQKSTNPKGEDISNMKRIKEFMIEAMNKLNKAYAKLFKKCLVLKESKKKSNATKRKSKKS
jgi:acyl-[acyl carrier protein]--UDP-N-acetylglucosamine O-acyltransferase